MVLFSTSYKMAYILLVIALVLNASANILIKMGANKFGAERIAGGMIRGIANNYFLLLGVFLFGLNIIFYMLALTKINISIAYPIMTSGCFLIIAVFSALYLKETITPLQIAGIILIALGITLISYHIK